MTLIPYSLAEIRERIGGDLIGPEPTAANSLFLAFDSRKIHQAPRTIFIALQGRRDGHDYIAKAYALGVRRFWVSDASQVPTDCQTLVVADTLAALQELARLHRQTLDFPVIGITGSNGKTIVKEWLHQLLSGSLRMGRSPGSYNSQLGVALSLLALEHESDLGLVEAGISEFGEMAMLSEMVKADYGILTHFEDAHAAGFPSEAIKLQEKIKLFEVCKKVFVTADDPLVLQALREKGLALKTVGRGEHADLRLLDTAAGKLLLEEAGETVELQWGWKGEANLENVLLALLVAREWGLSWEELERQMALIFPISMRLEMLTDNPEITVLNDAWNADQASVRNALALLQASQSQPRRMVVLTDLDPPGPNHVAVHQELLDLARKMLGPENLVLIGPIFSELVREDPQIRAYIKLEDLLRNFAYRDFRSSTVLLKGGRRYRLERLIPYLSRRATATHLRINLDHLATNFRWFRGQLPSGTRMMVMVKALGYGAGDWEVSEVLVREGVDYLGVAYTSGGIQLRTRGIQVPIMVMNPDPSNLEQLFEHKLEPILYDFEVLRAYVETGQRLGIQEQAFHLELDTGMRRLGFLPSDLKRINELVKTYPQLRVRSVLSHLAVADEPGLDHLTQRQAAEYVQFVDGLELPAGHPAPIRQLLNTAGILRFPEYSFDMVRLGIGLYGISPFEHGDWPLEEVASLHSVVTQVHAYPPGTHVGYGASETTARASKIATVAIGYADGIRRALGNGKMALLVRGQRAPIIGRVCMDMLMLDVTDIAGVEQGDEVVVMGRQGKDQISVHELAQACDTIPYEILVNIGQRVQRLYVWE